LDSIFLRALIRGFLNTRRNIADQAGHRLARTISELLSKQGPDQPTRIKADGGGNVQELQHIETPVPSLVFRHVRRRLAEPIGHDRLSKTGRFAPRLEELAQFLVAWGVNGL
jgi:hypothetical protein